MAKARAIMIADDVSLPGRGGDFRATATTRTRTKITSRTGQCFLRDAARVQPGRFCATSVPHSPSHRRQLFRYPKPIRTASFHLLCVPVDSYRLMCRTESRARWSAALGVRVFINWNTWKTSRHKHNQSESAGSINQLPLSKLWRAAMASTN